MVTRKLDTVDAIGLAYCGSLQNDFSIQRMNVLASVCDPLAYTRYVSVLLSLLCFRASVE